MPDLLQSSFVNYSEKAPNQTLETNCRPEPPFRVRRMLLRWILRQRLTLATVAELGRQAKGERLA